MQIGITGATGFIGKNLVNKFLKNGYLVKALVVENKPDLPKEVKYVKGDIVKDINIDKFLQDVDVVVHLAGRFNPPEDLMMADNVIGMFNLVKHLYNSNVKQVIFMSSIAVYGNGRGKNFKETDTCLPDSVYGLSKYLAEEVLLQYQRNTSNNVVILRPFNIYGPLNKQGIVFSLYSDILDNNEVTIYGDGKQERSYVYIDDLLDLFLKVVSKKSSGIYNVGSKDRYSVVDLLDQIKDITNQNFKINYDASKKAQVYNIKQDLNLINTKLGWNCETSIKEGLIKTIDWYKKQ